MAPYLLLTFQQPRLCVRGPTCGSPTCLTVDSSEAHGALADEGPREVSAGASISAGQHAALICLYIVRVALAQIQGPNTSPRDSECSLRRHMDLGLQPMGT
jgi:hypothetical protein